MTVKTTCTSGNTGYDLTSRSQVMGGGEENGGYNRGGGVHLLKYSLILSLETFSGRFPTHRWRVSLTIAPANHRCWHQRPPSPPHVTLLHIAASPLSTPRSHSLTSSRAVTDVSRPPPSPRRRPLRPSRPLSSSAARAGRSYTR